MPTRRSWSSALRLETNAVGNRSVRMIVSHATLHSLFAGI